MRPGDQPYVLRPEDFVAARSVLVRQLKADGRKEEAAAVVSCDAPAWPVWALNQVAREYPKLMAAAIEAGQQLRAASVEGSGRPSGRAPRGDPWRSAPRPTPS